MVTPSHPLESLDDEHKQAMGEACAFMTHVLKKHFGGGTVILASKNSEAISGIVIVSTDPKHIEVLHNVYKTLLNENKNDASRHNN